MKNIEKWGMEYSKIPESNLLIVDSLRLLNQSLKSKCGYLKKKRLYSLKSKVLSKLVANGEAIVIGYHKQISLFNTSKLRFPDEYYKQKLEIESYAGLKGQYLKEALDDLQGEYEQIICSSQTEVEKYLKLIEYKAYLFHEPVNNVEELKDLDFLGVIDGVYSNKRQYNEKDVNEAVDLLRGYFLEK